jgi:hypothetical protein
VWRETRKDPAWLLDEAVRRGTALNVKISLISRENTGNIAVSGGARREKPQLEQQILRQIPLLTEQGI